MKVTSIIKNYAKIIIYIYMLNSSTLQSDSLFLEFKQREFEIFIGQ